jgi:hypothetical protein
MQIYYLFLFLRQISLFQVLLIIGSYLYLLSACQSFSPGNNYYLSEGGDDTNTGLSPGNAWKTINKLNETDIQPGDKILLHSGNVFKGTLILDIHDSGTKDLPVIISTFGSGRAIIDGGNSSAVLADSCSHFSFSNLVLQGNGRKEGNTAEGFFASNCSDLSIDSLEAFGFQHSGIHIFRCRDASVRNCYAHDNGFAGIHVTGTTIWDSTAYDNKNIYIGYCITENNPGDPTVLENHSGSGIIASSVDSGVIEYCESFNNGWDMPWNGNGPVGIWIWDCSHFVIQHCISHDNKTGKGAWDGGGFDFDGGVSNSLLQYNLSYNNRGPGIGLFEFGAKKVWEKNVVRYNISRDDGENGQGSLAIWKGEAGGVIRECEIYNNVFYNSRVNGPNLCPMNNWPDFNFRNNIFVYNGTFLMKGKSLGTELFQRNCYWNLAGNKEFLGFPSVEAWANKTGNEILQGQFRALVLDPGFEVTGTSDMKDPRKLTAEFFKAFCLKPGSRLIDAGLDLKTTGKDPGINDFLGNSIPAGKGFDIGAIEFTGQK